MAWTLVNKCSCNLCLQAASGRSCQQACIPKMLLQTMLKKAWEEGGHLYIQTELCQQSLKFYCEQFHDPADETFIWECLADLALGLRHIHDVQLGQVTGIACLELLVSLYLAMEDAYSDIRKKVASELHWYVPRYRAEQVVMPFLQSKCANTFDAANYLINFINTCIMQNSIQ